MEGKEREGKERELKGQDKHSLRDRTRQDTQNFFPEWREVFAPFYSFYND